MGPLARLVLVLATLAPLSAAAVQLEALDVARDWRLRALRFRGNAAVRTGDLQQAMETRPRIWFAVWRGLPPFDPMTFRGDLERLRQLYRSRGYYHARVDADVELPAAGDAVTAVVYVDEGAPVRVENLVVALGGVPPSDADRARLLGALPLVQGRVFTQEDYDRAFTLLRTWYREHGYARVTVAKRAEVDVRRDAVTVTYDVDSGGPSTFGEVRVTGTRTIDPRIVRREIAFHPGDPFRQSLLDRTRASLVGLNLFRSVRIDEDKSRAPRVDVRIHVAEGPAREVRVGVGYDTEEQIRGLASWRDHNFLGGARQLGFSGRISLIRRTIAADFLQPHWPVAAGRSRLLLFEQQEEEEGYTDDRSRLSPRIEWQARPSLTVYGFYRLDYDSLSNVNGFLKAIPGLAPGHALLSGFGLGADWNETDDLLDPTRGWVTSTSVEPVGGILGGDVGFVRALGEGRLYQPLPARFVLALRTRLGAEEPLGGTTEIPLFERFYAGGINSVRGYERRHVGPLTPPVKDPLGQPVRYDNDPIGGRSLVEFSFELRHPITEKLGGAVFLDGGQVSLESFDFPVGDLQYGAGVGVRYRSPVGPLHVDLGFPAEPPHGDARWQIHLSLGQSF